MTKSVVSLLIGIAIDKGFIQRLALSACDMARIEQMCLNGGVYNSRWFVSSEWIDAMTAPRYYCSEDFGNMAYGYLWWIIDEKTNTYAAIGDGGNVIYINLNKDTVVAIAATFMPHIFDRVQFIQEQIELLL